jgi:prepilin-type N-terminal cleavage/methylation domain-containing protein
MLIYHFKRAFTLIELIFVILIIGLLAATAIPKFKNLIFNSKKAAIKSLIFSVQASIENIHGKWVVNDDYNWSCGGIGLNSNGYPQVLDRGDGKLFSCVLKSPIIACKRANCWDENETNYYQYYFSDNKVLNVEYNSTLGKIICKEGINFSEAECNETLFK